MLACQEEGNMNCSSRRRYGKLFNGHRDLANLYCFRERFPNSHEIDVLVTKIVLFPRKIPKFARNRLFVTKIVLFLRKIPNFARNRLFCDQNRIVFEKDSQFHTKLMFLSLNLHECI